MASKKLHIVMFPWLAFGHIIPHFDLAKLIAQKGHSISFVSTPRNIDRLPNLPPSLASSITLIKLPLPKVTGLPENAEATLDIDGAQMDLLKKAFDSLEDGMARFLEEARPDWIIYDFAQHWLPPIAARLNISGVFFSIINAWMFVFSGNPENMVSGSDYRTKLEDFTVPPKWVEFDTKVAFRRHEAKWFFGMVYSTESGCTDAYRCGSILAGSEALFLRSCYEFEPQWLAESEKVLNKRVIPLGLMPPQVPDKVDGSWVGIQNWLDGHKEGSVVYVAFGSETTLSQDQLSELAHGLEISGVPFFWVLREAASGSLPSGFEERVSGRGIVWKRWAPQLKILSHDSVGGFLTHCGWSSVVEGLMFGLPLIALPFVIDQGLTARIVAEKGIGIEIPRDEEDGSYTRDSVADSVKRVMLEIGEKYRQKAKETAGVFGDRELHDKYIDKFVDFLENHPRS